MNTKQPLERRIIIAFTVMTLLVSGTFSLGIVGIVHFIEEHLVSQELDRQLHVVVHEDLPKGHPPRLDPETRFYASNLEKFAIPPQFNQQEPGFTEVVDGDEAFYVYMQEINGVRYVLVQEQDEFEQREQALFNVVLAGFLLSIVGAWVLGRFMARKIMQPVSRLAQQVQHRDQLLPLAPPLAPEYADDEIGHLAAAFDRTLSKLRSSLEREKLFTSDVSHELRTPLMIIASSCELLSEANLSEKDNTHLQRIQRASEEMHDLVQTFLILARSKPEEAILGGQATLQKITDAQVEQWQPLFTEKNIHFQLCTAQPPNQVFYNAIFLRTVLSNLLRNALHYTEQGEVILTLYSDHFTVEDTGIGIPVGFQENIFEPFTRGENARGEGLGLGLSLVRRICNHQGWSIQVSTRTPTGSCFRVLLDTKTDTLKKT
ncbi:sensor histidine kinase [Denitrificimonas caeni]|uniref:sensor histidine kinase n=1 Tax=Denitrificimonas caeni TaxID=521720 RepID=UPI001964B8AA|nr:HAMP domain-containing sensor histidine kinase [Denitrificimonas caeni]